MCLCPPPLRLISTSEYFEFFACAVHLIIIIIFFLAQLAVIKHELKATQIAAAGFKTGHTPVEHLMNDTCKHHLCKSFFVY